MAGQSDSVLTLATVLVTGNDARSFLQGQLTNDVRTLSPDRALLAGVTTPQGRVLALATLLERPEGIVVVLSAALSEPIVARWRSHVLSAKVCLEVGRWRVAGLRAIPAAPELAPPPRAAGECRHGAEQSVLRWWGVGDRYLLLAPASACVDGAEWSVYRSLEWHRADVASGIPQIYPGTHTSFIPQVLNLDLLGAVSFSKGCYVGQEVVARAQRAGVARRMRRFRSTCAPPALGTRVVTGDSVAGEVVDAVDAGFGSDLLVVLDLDKLGLPLSLEGNDAALLEPAPLPYTVPLERAPAPLTRLPASPAR